MIAMFDFVHQDMIAGILLGVVERIVYSVLTRIGVGTSSMIWQYV